MHSSRMRTGRSLTVCWSLFPGREGGGRGVCVSSSQGGVCSGGVSAPGDICSGGGVSANQGGGGVCSGGVSASWGGCLLWGVCSRGVSALGERGVCSWGVVSQHALRQTPPPVDRITDACKNITLAQLRCGR